MEEKMTGKNGIGNVIGNLLNLVGNIGGIVAGVKSIQYAKAIRLLDVGEYVSNLAYGGDAYTGIQNAGAKTACNVQDLAILVRNGLSALLTVIGIALIFFFISRIHWKTCGATEKSAKNVCAELDDVMKKQEATNQMLSAIYESVKKLEAESGEASEEETEE